VALDFGFPFVTAPRGTTIDDDVTSWEAGLVWRVSERLRLFARAERNFRFANADEYSSIANFNAFPFPAPLPFPTTQTGHSYDLGAEWTAGAVATRIVGYRIDTDDEIAFEPFTFANFNIGDSRRYGLGAHVSWQPGPRWRVHGSYGFVDAELTSGRYAGRDVTFVARHSGQASVEHHWTERAHTTFEVNGISARRLSGDFDGTLRELQGHFVAHLRHTWTHDDLSVSVRANNLFDAHYSDAAVSGFDFRTFEFPVPAYFPAPERNFMLTLQYRYD
jgi:iron complex outermembrane receptor protein